MNKIITEQVKIEINDLRLKTSYKLKEIASFYGVSIHAIWENTLAKPPKFTQDGLIELNRLYDSGISNVELQALYKTNYSTINSRIWHPRPCGRVLGSKLKRVNV